MKLSIVIVSWNTRQLLAQCLESVAVNLKSLGLIVTETLVVDNASIDGTVDMLRQQFPWVKVVANRDNAGFAKANNQAIVASSGDYILLLNPDTKLHANAIATLVTYLDTQPMVGAVGPLLENPDGTLQFSCSPAPTLLGESWRLLHPNRGLGHGAYPMQGWSRHQPREVDVIQGACLLLRRSVIEQVGPLDEDYYIYSEEVDLCARIRAANWRIFWVPTAHVTHYGGQSTRQVATEMFIQLYASKVIYFRKHHGAQAAWRYKFVLLAASLLRIVAAGAAWMIGTEKRQQYLRVATNYRRLVAALPTI